MEVSFEQYAAKGLNRVEARVGRISHRENSHQNAVGFFNEKAPTKKIVGEIGGHQSSIPYL